MCKIHSAVLAQHYTVYWYHCIIYTPFIRYLPTYQHKTSPTSVRFLVVSHGTSLNFFTLIAYITAGQI